MRDMASESLQGGSSRAADSAAAVPCSGERPGQRFWIETEKRWVSLRVSTQAMRTIEKRGIDVVLAELRADGVKV